MLLQKKAIKEKSKWVMLSDHPFKRFWDFLMIFMLAYVATLVPFNICFKTSDISENRDINWTGSEILALIIDMLFFIDMIVNFFSSYDNP